MRKMALYAAGMGIAVSTLATGASGFTIAGDTMNTDPGFNPWVGDTNYRWTITTDGTNGRFNEPNQGDDFGGSVTNLNIANNEWINANAAGELSMSGTVTQIPTSAHTYLQIGIVTRAQAERGADWYASGMFNNAAFINFNYQAVSVGDTAGSHTSIATGLNPSDQVDFEVKFEFPSQVVSGRVNINGNGWTSWFSRNFGTDNWGWGSYEDPANFDEVAFQIDMWGDDPGAASSTASYGDITAIPEPASLAFLALGGLALLRRRVATLA